MVIWRCAKFALFLEFSHSPTWFLYDLNNYINSRWPRASWSLSFWWMIVFCFVSINVTKVLIVSPFYHKNWMFYLRFITSFAVYLTFCRFTTTWGRGAMHHLWVFIVLRFQGWTSQFCLGSSLKYISLLTHTKYLVMGCGEPVNVCQWWHQKIYEGCRK